MRVATRPGPEPSADRALAGRLLWTTLGLLLLTVGVGLGWDRAWHASHAFDTFYSPPHLFIYATTVLEAALVAYLVGSRRLRAWFGPTFRLPALPYAVPGALALLASGFALLLLAGALDDLWHSRFGLDETAWSTPHAMLGWAWLLIVLGIVACRLALRGGEPLPWYEALGLGAILLAFSVAPLLGPLAANPTAERVRAAAALPVLAAQPAAQHTFRIYLAHHLDRASPLLLPLGALWAGAALTVLHRLARRDWVPLLAVALVSLAMLASARRADLYLDAALGTHLAAVPATWLPLPLLPAALAGWLARRLRLGAGPGAALAGLVFALAAALLWSPPAGLLLLPLAVAAGVLGARLGGAVFATLAQPTAAGVGRLVAVAGLLLPLAVGAIDLYLRASTP